MTRREFVGLVGGATAWPLAALGQVAGKVWRLGFLSVTPQAIFSPVYCGFVQGMRELGYVDGKDFVSEWR